MRNQVLFKRLALSIFIITFVLGARAQKTVPVLWRTVNNAKLADTSRFNALYELIVLIPYERANDSSLFFAEKSKTFAISRNAPLAIAAATYIQAYIYMRKNDGEKSLLFVNDCLGQLNPLTAKNPDDETLNILTANVWIVSGMNHTNKYEHIAAIKDYQEAYRWAIKTRFKKITGSTLGAISNAYQYTGEYLKALEYIEKTIVLHEEAGYQKGVMQATNSCGNIYNYMGDQPKAIEKYSAAKSMALETGENRLKAMYTSNLAGVYIDMGNTQKAYDQYLDALKTAIEINDQSMMGVIYGNLSNVYYNQMNELQENGGNPDSIEVTKKRMVDVAEKNVAIREKQSDIQHLASAYNSISQAYFLSDQYEKAILYAKKSRDAATKAKKPSEISIANNSLSNFYLSKNKLDSAEQYTLIALEQAKEIKFMRQVLSSWSNLSQIKQKQNDYALAEKYATEILEYNNKVVATNFVILSEKEKELYFETLAQYYDGFNLMALHRKKENPAITEKVYNTAIKNKGLLLKSSTAMRNAILSGKDTSLVAAYNHWLHLKQEISKAFETGSDIHLLEEQSNELEKELVKRSQVFSDFDRINNISWKEVQKGLKKGEAAIEFIRFNGALNYESVSKNIYCALIVKPGSTYPEMIQICTEVSLERILGVFGGNNLNYINGIYTHKNEKEEALYDLIWKPLEPSLDKIKSVYISPAGLLHKVSFAAISKSKNTYLCDNYTINIQSSTARVAAPENAVFTNNMNTSVFGGIDYNSDSSKTTIWPYLEGTKNETSQITGLLKKNKMKVDFFSSASATEETLKEKAVRSDILHIATHGFFFPSPSEFSRESRQKTKTGDVTFRGGSNGFGVESFVENKNPLMRSGLVFAHANDVWSKTKNDLHDDGVLTAQEVAQLDMRNTQLVVLSACETGLGDIKGSEGVYGLQRAFKMAGVKFLVMSLWQVPDKETSEFMVEFYKKIISTGDIRIAFTQTQKIMRKKYSPYYWAAFELLE